MLMVEKRIRLPRCPGCEKGMVPSLSFSGRAYACLPCNQTADLFNRLPGVAEFQSEVDDRLNHWRKDLHAIAILYGGGCCIGTRNGGDACPLGICPVPENYHFEYWKVGNAPRGREEAE